MIFFVGYRCLQIVIFRWVQHYHIQGLGIWMFILFFFFFTFFSNEVETSKWISRVWVRIFGNTSNYYNLVRQSTLFIVFSLLLHFPLWESQEIISLLSWLVRVLDLVYFWSSMVYNSVTACSVTNFFSRNLFESPTNYMCSKVILSFFFLYTKGYFKVTSRW